jgi:hypothetical protein
MLFDYQHLELKITERSSMKLKDFYWTRLAGMGGALAAMALAFNTPAAPVVVNGSFEADPFNINGTLDLGGRGGPLTGWTTLSNDTYPWGLPNANTINAGPTPYGNQWVIVGDFGRGGTWIEQIIGGFTVGDSYTLSFALASEYNNGGGGSPMQVSFPGSSIASQTFSAPLRGANFWDTWSMFSLPFVADNTTLTIRMEGLPGADYDAGIDNVSISGGGTVPEPVSTAGLLGFAAVLLLQARRRFGKS